MNDWRTLRPCRNHEWYLGDCLRCGERYQLPPPEGKNVELPQAILDSDAAHHARAFDGAFPAPATAAAANQEPPLVNTKLYDYAIKSWPAFFSQMVAGVKKHDMRDKSERDYRVGDRVLLCEYDPFGGGYTGRAAVFKITYITSNDTPCAMSSNALARDACILSVELLGEVI